MGRWYFWNAGYNRLFEITTVVKATKPDRLLAVGGDSVIDGAKFISAEWLFPDDKDAWETLIVNREFPDKVIDFECAATCPATGSERNGNLLVSRRSVLQNTVLWCSYTSNVWLTWSDVHIRHFRHNNWWMERLMGRYTWCILSSQDNRTHWWTHIGLHHWKKSSLLVQKSSNHIHQWTFVHVVWLHGCLRWRLFSKPKKMIIGRFIG